MEAKRLTGVAVFAEAQSRFRAFACGLTRHIDVEERVLFPAFEAMAGSATGPTVVTRAEHEEIRHRLDQPATILEEHDPTAAKNAIDALTDILSMHNLKEEAILSALREHELPLRLERCPGQPSARREHPENAGYMPYRNNGTIFQ